MPLSTEIAASQLSRLIGLPNAPAIAAQWCGRRGAASPPVTSPFVRRGAWRPTG